MNKLVYIAICLTVFGCKSKKDAISEPKQQEEQIIEQVEEKPKRPQQLIARIGKFPDSAPIVIDTAIIVANTLYLTVNYSGGCKYHKFEFIGSPAIMKSMPPKRSVKLVHYDDDDTCESLVNEQIEIDIRELSVTETTGSEIVLLIENYQYPVHYIYP
jgi:hypothetical protein